MTHFWKNLPRPVVGLSPMDGVTDAPFRYIAAKHGRPDVIFTEFVPVEAITHNAVRVMSDLLYGEIERPVVAQLYGAEPESFYKVAHVICEMGFDGIDINMGCPAKNVVHHGCGASLIKDPGRAKAIVRATKQAVKDWREGSTMERVGIAPKIIRWVREFKAKTPSPLMGEGRGGGDTSDVHPPLNPLPSREGRRFIPVSIKTRLGYSENIITDWVRHLLEVEPVAISIHGRTLKQMYKGVTDWDAIAAAAEIIHQTPTLVLGNGDVKSAADAAEKIRASGVDGVLIGRAACGNPWVFKRKDEIRHLVRPELVEGRTWAAAHDSTGLDLMEQRVTPEEGLNVLLEHARLFDEMCPDMKYVAMRKHIGWYARWIPALRLRKKELMQVNSYQELVRIVMPALNDTVEKPASSASGSPLNTEPSLRG